MFLLLVVVIIMIIRLHFIQPIQERYPWLKPVGIRVRVAEFDANYGVGMSVP